MSVLYTSSNEKEYIVTKMPDDALLNSFGVFNGSKITKKLTYKMGGPVMLDIKGRGIAIGKEIAMQIEVKEN